MKAWVAFAGFYLKWAIFIYFQEATVGVSDRGSHHLVSGHGELLELCMKLWVAPRGAGHLGLCCRLPAAKKKRTHVTPIMTYIKTSHYVSHREADVKCHLSPFGWCLTMSSYVQAAPSPMGEEAWSTHGCGCLWQSGDLQPIPHSAVLWTKRVNVTIGKNQMISDMTSEKCLVSHQDGGFYDWVLNNQALL